MSEIQKGEGMPITSEQQLPIVEQRADGVFLGKIPLYNPEVNNQRDPFVESVAPFIVTEANKYMAKNPDKSSDAKRLVTSLGLNPELVSLNVQSLPSLEQVMKDKGIK